MAVSLPRTAPAEETVATIDGRPVTANELQLTFFLNQLSESASPEQRRQLLDQLIDRRLIRKFLEGRQINVSPALADRDLDVIRRLLEMKNENLDDVLGKLRLTEESLREMLALPRAWRGYVEQVLTETRLKEYWAEHRRQYDGSRVRAAQIVRTVRRDAGNDTWEAAERQLAELRRQIDAGTLTFADAARQHSDSPSGRNGGDLGEIEYHGRVPEAVARAAFSLMPGEVSQPVRSPFGVHLVTVQERIPGDLSLEDVRDTVIQAIARQMWDDQVRIERQQAKIEILSRP